MIKRIVLAAAFVFVCVWSLPASAACAGGNCFVVAAGGNSNSTATWAVTSGGTTCTCLPASTDHVILNSLAGNLTINAALSVGTFDASGTGGSGSPYTGTVTQSTTNALTINAAATNSLKFSTQMTYAPGAANSTAVIFANTSGTAVITSSGKNFAAITLNGVGGTVQQADDLNVTAVPNSLMTITNGIWDANGHSTATTLFVSTGAAARTLILGSVFKIGGNTTNTSSIWNVTSTLTLTLTSGGAIEIVSTTPTALQGVNFVGGGLAYNGLILDDNANPNGITLSGNNTWTSWTIGGGWHLLIPNGGTQTLSGNLAVNGTATKFSSLVSNNGSTASTLAVTGTCTGVYTILFGTTFTTCVAKFSNSVNLGGNTLNGGSIVVIGGGGVSAPGGVNVP